MFEIYRIVQSFNYWVIYAWYTYIYIKYTSLVFVLCNICYKVTIIFIIILVIFIFIISIFNWIIMIIFLIYIITVTSSAFKIYSSIIEEVKRLRIMFTVTTTLTCFSLLGILYLLGRTLIRWEKIQNTLRAVFSKNWAMKVKWPG